MKKLLTISLFLFSLSLLAQSNENEIRPENQTVLLKKSNGEILRIHGQICSETKDTVLITVEKINNSTTSTIQKFKTICSFPLEIKSNSLNDQAGILIKYDPAVKNGNCFLYLFNEETDKLQQVIGFRNLGMIKTILNNGKTYNYSYASCGCADNCWKSVLFKIQNYQIDTLAYLSCDCEKLIERMGKNEKKASSNCDNFNNIHKFQKIDTYWKEKIKNGL